MSPLDGDWFWNALRRPQPHPNGTRIRLLAMPQDPNPVPLGTLGTVTGGNGAQLWVAWDDGRSLALALDIDRYEVLH
jgi:hypothetical protein